MNLKKKNKALRWYIFISTCSLHSHSMAGSPSLLHVTETGIQAPCSEVTETTEELQNTWQQLQWGRVWTQVHRNTFRRILVFLFKALLFLVIN